MIGWLHKVSGALFMLFSVQEEPQFYELFENILHGLSWKIISETSQALIKTFVQHFEQKNIFSDIPLPRRGKNMSIALQNMTKSKKTVNYIQAQ